MIDIDWMADALCHEAPELPWIAEPADAAYRAVLAMRAICHGCPVLAECRQFARHVETTGGFWAGAFQSADDDAFGGAA